MILGIKRFTVYVVVTLDFYCKFGDQKVNDFYKLSSDKKILYNNLDFDVSVIL